MRFSCAQRAAQTDLSDAFLDGNQHDVRYADAADAQRHGADEEKQSLDANGDAFHDGLELFPAKHGDGALIVRRKVLPIANGRAKLLHRLRFKHRSDRLEDHHARILRVPEVVGGGVRNKSGFVVAIKVTAVGKLHVHRADDGKRHALDAHNLADGGLAAEKLLAQTRAKKSHAAAFSNIFGRNPASVGWHFVAHLAVFGKHTTHGAV